MKSLYLPFTGKTFWIQINIQLYAFSVEPKKLLGKIS